LVPRIALLVSEAVVMSNPERTPADRPGVPPLRHRGAALVFIEMRLSAKSGTIFEKFKREVMKLPNVLECHLVQSSGR
jgi:DNA-binding Lrp family transcriptional regulator